MGRRRGGHIVRMDPVLPFGLCDLRHGRDQGMGSISGLPF